MARAIGTVEGTALVPGISRNGRLYTVDNIAKAVERAQTRLTGEGLPVAYQDGPLTQRTHHAADDDSTRIVGRITKIWQDDSGAAKFEADLADTDHGRTILNLVRTDDGPPFLKTVSIRGGWIGPVRRITGPGGHPVETADDLELDGLDYTARPGVPGAVIDHAVPAADSEQDESAGQRAVIYESVQEALVTATTPQETAELPPILPVMVEAFGQVWGHRLEDGHCRTCAAVSEGGDAPGDGSRPYGNVVYADPGYQADKKKRYPLDTKAHAKAAWSYLHQGDNAKAYTAAQLKRIKGKILKALKAFGVSVSTTDESAGHRYRYIVDETAPLPAEVLEYIAQGSFSINLCNGPVNITISSYCIDPADLDLVGRAAMDGACQALAAIDPDMDGDIDVPGADAEDTDNDQTASTDDGDGDGGAQDEPNLAQRLLAAALGGEGAPTDSDLTETQPAPDPATDPTETEAPVTESTQAVEQPQAAPPSTITLTNDQFQQLLATVRPAAPQAPAQTAQTPAQATQETVPAAAPQAPSAPAPTAAVAETDEQRIERLVRERVEAERTRLVQETVENGGLPTRKGLVQPVNEHRAPTPAGSGATDLNQYGVPSDWPDKPLHKYTAEEKRQYFGPAIQQYVLGARAEI